MLLIFYNFSNAELKVTEKTKKVHFFVFQNRSRLCFAIATATHEIKLQCQ